MEVLLEFKEHHYMRDFTETDLYCPLCGKQTIWMENDAGDYYLGVDYVCISCGAYHCLEHSCRMDRDEPYVRIVEQLRIQKTFKPKTPIGK